MKYSRHFQQFGTRPIWGICALLSLPLFLGQSAVAGTITFNDLGVPFITDTTGGRVTGSCTLSEVCTVVLQSPTGTAGANFTSPVNIFEDNTLTVVSDTFRFTNIGLSTTTMQFVSDPTELGLTPLPQPASFIVETGAVQQVGIINWFLDAAHGGGTVTDTIFFQSGEATAASPEPSGLILGGLGIALIALGRRRSTHA